ncbi:hypothetical protein ABGN05_29555 [Aquibium sp. LZ166]|uniref:Phospholipase D-like domain-containing protein n=1 Tax=Aquibium pacificus TaxID=3153579 RepID=A0ABV3SW55_9HYPH
MKLYDRFSDKGYHTCIATTFGIDFDAYESIVLPRLRGAGCRNNIVIADSRMLTHALNGASSLPRLAGRLYTVSGFSGSGVFHPKLFLQLGRKGGRLIVASANLTASGLAGNLELVATITCGTEDSGEQRLIISAWEYINRLIDQGQQAIASQRDWTIARTPWLRQAITADSSVELTDKTLASFLATGSQPGIAARFADLIDEPVSRLIVVSPYWDTNLEALTFLAERLQPAETAILIDPGIATFPRAAIDNIQSAQLYDRGNFRAGRFIHAKAIIAQTESSDHVLMGSANCTTAALGTGTFSGLNEEACLYRKLPRNVVIEALELTDCLSPDRTVDRSALSDMQLEDDIPLDELAAQAPGKFECRVDVLSWQPANAIDPNSVKVELLNEYGQPIDCQLSPLNSQNEKLRFNISGTENRPAFARLLFSDGHRSALAIVAVIDRLSSAIRETHSRKTENALRELDGETEANLMLLEVLDVLEQLESDDESARAPISVPKKPQDRTDPNGGPQYKTLSYEQFIAGRRPRTDNSKLTNNSLAGSEVSLVRGFLNRILGMQDDQTDNADEDEKALAGAFDLGDETDNAEAAIASGQEFDSKQKPPEQTEQGKELQRKKAAQRQATKEQIVAAATSLGKRVKERQSQGKLDNRDILRLRAMLMIICAAAWRGPDKGSANKAPRSSLQVLPSEDDPNSWPFVIGRLLFVFFGGRDPAIKQLSISAEHDQLPDDIIECWATCYWCLQASMNANVSAKEKARINQHLGPIAELAYLLTLPTQREQMGEDVIALMASMSKRYAAQMGLDADKVARSHQDLVNRLAAPATQLVL